MQNARGFNLQEALHGMQRARLPFLGVGQPAWSGLRLISPGVSQEVHNYRLKVDITRIVRLAYLGMSRNKYTDFCNNGI